MREGPASNVYLDAESARRFVRAIAYDASALRSLAASLLALRPGGDGGRSALRVLDIGTGPGSFILPVAEYFEEHAPHGYSLDCLDVSEHMARLFEGRLARSRVDARKVRYILHDAERGLGEYRSAGAYDAVFVTFMLHYVGGWRRLLDEAAECLRPGGLLVMAEVVGDFKNIDGHPGGESPILFRQFWRRYFTERAHHSVWKPRISVSNLSPVYAYLRGPKRFTLLREDEFLWDTSATWLSFCEWIAAAPLSSLGSGLSAEARAALSASMRRWLAGRSIPETEEVRLRWGIKSTILRGKY